MSQPQKQCIKCHNILPESEFYVKKGYPLNKCKKCVSGEQAEKNKIRRNKNKSNINERSL